MIQARFQVLDKPLPKPADGWKKSPFYGGYTDTLDRLEREMRHLGATDIVFLVDADHSHIRNDGWPKSTMRPSTPGIIVTFETPAFGAMRYESGRFNSWEQNLRAVAMTLERLRAVDRYGCTKGEQYTGWKKLPTGMPTGEWASVEAAMRFLCLIGQPSTLSVLPSDLDTVYRAAARKAHPDAGGSHEVMSKVNRAKDYIEKSVAAPGARP